MGGCLERVLFGSDLKGHSGKSACRRGGLRRMPWQRCFERSVLRKAL
jgi:hypothetical protein